MKKKIEREREKKKVYVWEKHFFRGDLFITITIINKLLFK